VGQHCIRRRRNKSVRIRLPPPLAEPGVVLGAGNGIARWLANAESGSGVEKALYRLMKLPGGEALYRRSPRETRPELTALLAAGENRAPLYSLRAMEDEQALDLMQPSAIGKLGRRRPTTK